MSQCEIKLYSLSTCSHCQDTKDLLKECQVSYDCIEIDNLEGEVRRNVIEEIKKINPECSLPTLVIGDKIVVGFKENKIREILEKA